MKRVPLYLILAATGIVLYIEAHAYATDWRGYVAYGGEIFFLGLPLFSVCKIVQTIFKPIKSRKDDHHV